MNYKSKYIIVDNKDGIIPVVFTELAVHKEVARGFMPGKILGAGFCWINGDGRYECYGESTSLNVKSNDEDDAKILNKFLGVNYE
jgi:hypothetical protein